MTDIALVDYGMGNRRSVEKALEHVGARVRRVADPDGLHDADGIVLPGVGAFPEAMRKLEAQGLVEPLRERVAAGVPLMGICLGMQLLFESSVEHQQVAGLGLIGGRVTDLDPGDGKLPHIGWNLVTLRPGARITSGFGEAAAFYHVHSYVCRPSDEADVAGWGEYGERFASIVERGNVFGAQFHPEKSSADGLKLLGNFLEVCAKVTA